MAQQVIINRGRQVNTIGGINGVSAGGNAVVDLDVNRRYHRLKYQCTAINYTGGTGLATVKLTGGGNNDLTVTPTIVNGVITAVAVVAGGTGYTTGDTITITDATGTGFVGTVTANGGAVSAVAVTSPGTPSPVSPATMINTMSQLVNGVNMRDISPLNTLKIAMANGIFPLRGELGIYYTTPWRDKLTRNDTGSWDVFGQSTFQMRFGIKTTASSPGLVGVSEFDGFRNTRDDGKGNQVLFIEPTSQHEFTWPVVAGRNDITTLPKNFPISRIWMQGSSAGNITNLEVYQDRNKIFEATIEQLRQIYEDYGFQFGQENWLNQNWATTAALKSRYEQPQYFDAAFISDPDQRWSKRLVVGSELIVRLTSAVAQNVTFVVEAMPGGFVGA